jgi:hypothetical protein
VTSDGSEASIYRSATIWFELKGEQAIDEAGRWMTETARRGDRRAAAQWVKIIAALEDLRSRVGVG